MSIRPVNRQASHPFISSCITLSRLTASVLLSALLMVASCGEKQQQATAPNPPEVDVALPLKQQIIEWDDFTGRFEAVHRVDIRARVTGYLVEQHFRDGQMVHKGDVLFLIDPRPFQYEVDSARAQYEMAKKAYQRALNLRKTQTIAQELFDQRVQELQVSEAAYDEAQLNLEFTEVKAPIDGKISDRFVDVGNLVSANDTLLTRIVSVDPIYFEFEGSQGDFLKYLRLDRAGKRPSSDTNPNPILIELLDEDSYSHMGRMDFVDNVIDSGTGTIRGRALVQNPDAIIYPGMFGRARLLGSGEYEALLLPENAINTDQSQKFVYTIDDDNRAQRTFITPGPVLDNGLVIIRQGLTGDERVVVNGIQRIRAPQQSVTPNRVPLTWKPLANLPDVSAVPSLEVIAAGSERQTANDETSAPVAE